MADLAQLQNKKDKSRFLKNPVAVCLLAMVCCGLWGSAFPFIKIGYNLFSIPSDSWQSQILFAGIRFFFAGVLVIIFGSLISRKFLKPKRISIKSILSLSVFQTILQYLFFYIGLAHTTGTKGSIINSTSVFFTVLVSALIFKQEKLDVKKILGCIIGFAGTVVINFSQDGFGGGISFLGEGFIVLCSLSYAFSSVLIKIYSKNENPVVLSGYQFMFGGMVMMIFGFVTGGRITQVSFEGVALVAYLAFLSAVAYTLWGILLKYNPVSRVAVFGFMTPVFGCLFSALFLNESILGGALKTVSALILVSLGIIIVNYSKGVKNYD